jgi:hypothetical protein
MELKRKVPLWKRRTVSSGFWALGFLTAVHGGRSVDTFTTARFFPSPINQLHRPSGHVHAIGQFGVSHVALLDYAVCRIREGTSFNIEDEVVWRFAHVVKNFWARPIGDLLEDESLVQRCQSADEPLSMYVLAIIGDLGASAPPGIEQVLLQAFFGEHRDKHFQRLRHAACMHRLDPDPDAAPRDENRFVLRDILTSTTPPPNCRAVVEFLMNQSCLPELIECVIRSANTNLPDRIALAMEENPTPEHQSAYAVRMRIYDLLIPVLRLASCDFAPAVNIVKDRLSKAGNECFRRFALTYFDKNCSPEAVIQCCYPDMIDDLISLRSRHASRVILVEGTLPQRIAEHVRLAKESRHLSVENRVGHVQRAIALSGPSPQLDQLIQIIRIMGEVDHPPKYLARPPDEILEMLQAEGEFRRALDVLAVMRQKRRDILTHFLTTASERDIAEYVAARGIFDEEEIVEALIEIRGSGEIRSLKNYGLSQKVAFSCLAKSGREKRLEWAADMLDLLDS